MIPNDRSAAPSANLQAAVPTTRASSRTRIAHHQTKHPKRCSCRQREPTTSL
jgi:hypothetical protein